MSKEPSESVRVLAECGELMMKKGADYQNPNSTVTQAMYYPNGVTTILDIIQAKYLRAKSLTEAMQAGHDPNFESIEDTFKDIINYAAFAVAYARGKIQGQNPDNDMLNRPRKKG